MAGVSRRFILLLGVCNDGERAEFGLGGAIAIFRLPCPPVPTEPMDLG